MHTMLSPIERAVVERCEVWTTMEELQLELFESHEYTRVPGTVAFLRRRKLLVGRNTADSRLEVVYKRTDLGSLVLLEQQRKDRRAPVVTALMGLSDAP